MWRFGIFGLLVAGVFLAAFRGVHKMHFVETGSAGISDTTGLAQVLELLGSSEHLKHKPKSGIKGVSVQAGRDLVLVGKTKKPSGGKTRRVSRHFECTACHNIQREDPDLSKSDPEARLKYVSEHGIPFLQASPFFGIVNRTGFYNGDYDKKYGDLVTPARNDMREAIQLCATECAQGRRLADWEIESILAYFWTLELRLKDLNLSEREMQMLNSAADDQDQWASARQFLRSKYLTASPATFVDPPENRQVGNPLTGSADNGKLIYEMSCLHCHGEKRYSFFLLDQKRMTFKHLAKQIPLYGHHNIYQVGRYGTQPLGGKKAYMPQYTLEKMSRQQMEDLRAYIEQEAGLSD